MLPCFRFVRSASHVLPWIIGTTSLVVALAPRLGGFGVLKNQFFFAVAVTRRLRLMLHLGRVPQAIAGSVPTHGVLALPGHRIFFKGGGSMLMLVRDLAP